MTDKSLVPAKIVIPKMKLCYTLIQNNNLIAVFLFIGFMFGNCVFLGRAFQENPLTGRWIEREQITCATGEQVVPDVPIGELEFQRNGQFSVTWTPFESYHDYWGTYQYDLAKGELDFVISNGNQIPANPDLSGKLYLNQNGKLILRDIWLGTTQQSDQAVNCGHIFEKFD